MSAHLVIAAAGLAEGVWMMEMLLFKRALCFIGLLALIALRLRSYKFLVAPIILLSIVTLIFQP